MLANNHILSCYPVQEQMEAIRQMREERAELAPVRPKPAAALGIGPINIRCATRLANILTSRRLQVLYYLHQKQLYHNGSHAERGMHVRAQNLVRAAAFNNN
jgi:hypothetical protein